MFYTNLNLNQFFINLNLCFFIYIFFYKKIYSKNIKRDNTYTKSHTKFFKILSMIK